MPSPAPLARERRRARRFPLRLPLDFCVRENAVHQAGVGETYDISSKGIRFIADFKPPIGWILELSVRWPVQVGNDVAIRLVVSGPVLRRDSHGIVVLIKNYHFQHDSA